MNMYRRRRLIFYFFISPWLFGFVLFQVIPIAWGFSVSLTNSMAFTVNRRFVGLANYVQLLKDPEILYSLFTTFIYTVSSSLLAVGIGLLIALLLERQLPGRGFFRTILYFPYMIPLIAVGWIFKIFLDRDTGFLNILLSRLGIIHQNIGWLAQFPRGAIVSLSLWMSGWSMIIFLGGLSTVPEELYEVARIDGAGYLRRLRAITLPLLSPFIFFQFVVSAIISMQKFIEPFILNPRQIRGGNLTQEIPPRETFFVMTRAYDLVFNRSRYAYGLALLWILFAVILVITLVFMKVGGFVVYSEAGERR